MRQPFERALVGRTLAGRYELGDAIGSGGMSVVYAGTDRVLGRAVAVKVVALPSDSEEVRANLRERFRREAGSAARIAHHPNIVQVYDYGTDPELDLDFIVMELLRGRDLKQALAQGSVPRGEAVRILREAARGLAAGHREGIVHRDVKPANVFLVGQDGRVEYVRVLDFGIAKPLEPDTDDALTLTTAGQLPHSPAYASPEALDPDLPVTPASDVYQLGLIGYELLTGDRPYSESERKRIREGEEVPLVATPRWSAVPAPLREVIERALRLDPARRYPDAAAFADALADAEDATLLHPGDDHTAFIAAPPLPRVVAADPAPVDAAAPAIDAGSPEPVSDEPLSIPSPIRPGRRWAPAVWGIPVLLLLLIAAIWASRRQRGAQDAAVRADTGAVAALHDRFLRLEGQAAAELAGAFADTADTAQAPPPDSAKTDTLSQAMDAAAVQRVVIDVHAAWSAGDLDRMMSHYASRADYYNVARATRPFIRRKVAETVRGYPTRKITLNRQAVMMVQPNLARVLVDKEWDFSGRGKRWFGSMRQELMLRSEDGTWKIISEKAVEIYNDKHTG
ncbi:serine/threonine-protein kinase [Longimicrobium sp.]|uniref:serine/threonine-protein kinase n=1 Tax=Longimicrobium sp. TaxID=2029185 RepID=UPI002C3B1EF3|nr:serine/threonine-protein kinase [Longimicrobium sp.]HSU12678.1 serine/threonine-protein kinase [Longimicrobium sp.]